VKPTKPARLDLQGGIGASGRSITREEAELLRTPAGRQAAAASDRYYARVRDAEEEERINGMTDEEFIDWLAGSPEFPIGKLGADGRIHER